MKKVFLLVLFSVFCISCANKEKLPDFISSEPVQVKRPTIRPGIYQRGENFEITQMFEHYQNNKEVQKKITKFKTYFYSGMLITAVGTVMVVGADTASDLIMGAGVGYLGFLTARHGTGHLLDIGDIHNRQFASEKSQQRPFMVYKSLNF